MILTSNNEYVTNVIEEKINETVQNKYTTDLILHSNVIFFIKLINFYLFY